MTSLATPSFARRPEPAPRRWMRATEAIDAPAPREIVQGVAWADSITTLVAESAGGKTFTLLDIGACVSADLGWHGRAVRHGSVVYIYFEGQPSLRLRALRDVAGHWLAHVYVIAATNPISPIIDRDRSEQPSLGEMELSLALDDIVKETAAAGLPPVVLFEIDTVRSSLAGSEDSSETVSAYLRAVRRLMAHLPGAACILAHHAGWQDGKEGRKRERGSSAFRGNVDATLYLDPGPYDRDAGVTRLTLTALKVREGEPAPPLRLVRRRVQLPGLVDPSGRPVTSCVIVPDPRSPAEVEADAANATAATDREHDRRVLHAVRDHPEATSQRALRAHAALKTDVFGETLGRLVASGKVTPPTKQRAPYTLTASGRAALEGAE